MLRPSHLLAALVLTSPAAAQPLDGVKACIASDVAAGQLRLTHVVEGTGDVISRDEWVFHCDGAAGLAAWDTLFTLRRNDPVQQVDRDGATVLVLAAGARSRCTKRLRNPDGSPATATECDLALDLSPEFQPSIAH